MTFKGNGIIWDAENDRPLVHFVSGLAEVKDERVIGILKANGFDEVKIESVIDHQGPLISENEIEVEPIQVNKTVTNAKMKKRK